MAKPLKPKVVRAKETESDPIAVYARGHEAGPRATCDRLRALIDAALPRATAKLWHGGPVWFDGENPVVGYDVKGTIVKLLFWNGRALGEPDLKPMGKHFAAEATFRDAAEIDDVEVRRWLRKAKANVFDSVEFFRAQREQAKASKAARRRTSK